MKNNLKLGKFISTHKYDDIINMVHPTSKKHPRMSLHDRAAQFAPFAALTGYNDAIEETARQTKNKIILSDDEKDILNRKISDLNVQINKKPTVIITYFVEDKKKSGGEYITENIILRKIDEDRRMLISDSFIEIPFDNVIDIKISKL